jgi:hypothetical protein
MYLGPRPGLESVDFDLLSLHFLQTFQDELRGDGLEGLKGRKAEAGELTG